MKRKISHSILFTYMKILCLSLIIALISFSSCKSRSNETEWKETDRTDRLMALYQNYQWKEALACIDSLRKEGVSLDILPIEAECYAGIGEYAKGIEMLEKEIEFGKAEDLHYFYNALGNIYHLKGEYENAIDNYLKSIELRPSYARPFLNLGETYLLVGNQGMCIKCFLSAINLFLEHAYYDEVIDYSTRILEIEQFNVEAYSYLQYGLLCKEQFEDALSVGMELYNASKENGLIIGPQNLLLTGMSAYHSRQYDIAYIMTLSAVQHKDIINEDAWTGICYLSAICYMQGDEEKAKEFETMAADIGNDPSSYIKDLCKTDK